MASSVMDDKRPWLRPKILSVMFATTSGALRRVLQVHSHDTVYQVWGSFDSWEIVRNPVPVNDADPVRRKDYKVAKCRASGLALILSLSLFSNGVLIYDRVILEIIESQSASGRSNLASLRKIYASLCLFLFPNSKGKDLKRCGLLSCQLWPCIDLKSIICDIGHMQGLLDQKSWYDDMMTCRRLAAQWKSLSNTALWQDNEHAEPSNALRITQRRFRMTSSFPYSFLKQESYQDGPFSSSWEHTLRSSLLENQFICLLACISVLITLKPSAIDTSWRRRSQS